MFNLQAEDDALGPSKSEKAALNAVTPQVEPVVKRKKRPKGPNPLSVKKKAPKATLVATTRVEKSDVGSKRKRQEAHDIGGVSVETQPKSKRRRRHKAASLPAQGPK
jgi:U3 small nucleolar RNA-associated protein 23